MLDKLLKNKVRVIIPFQNEDVTDYIEILNPNEDVIKHIKERVISRINGEDDFSNSDILDYLIKQLTNVKLEMSIDDLLLEDLSHECKMLLYHITDIYNEIQNEILCVAKMDIARQKIEKLEEEVAIEMQQV